MSEPTEADKKLIEAVNELASLDWFEGLAATLQATKGSDRYSVEETDTPSLWSAMFNRRVLSQGSLPHCILMCEIHARES